MSKSVEWWEKKTSRQSFWDRLLVRSAVFVVGFNISFYTVIDFAPLLGREVFQQVVQFWRNRISRVVDDILEQCVGRHIQGIGDVAKRIHLGGLIAPLNTLTCIGVKSTNSANASWVSPFASRAALIRRPIAFMSMVIIPLEWDLILKDSITVERKKTQNPLCL